MTILSPCTKQQPWYACKAAGWQVDGPFLSCYPKLARRITRWGKRVQQVSVITPAPALLAVVMGFPRWLPIKAGSCWWPCFARSMPGPCFGEIVSSTHSKALHCSNWAKLGSLASFALVHYRQSCTARPFPRPHRSRSPLMVHWGSIQGRGSVHAAQPFEGEKKISRNERLEARARTRHPMCRCCVAVRI